MTPYEGVLSCYLLAVKILRSSYVDVDNMLLDELFDFINVYKKINSDHKEVFIDDIL